MKHNKIEKKIKEIKIWNIKKLKQFLLSMPSFKYYYPHRSKTISVLEKEWERFRYRKINEK